MVLPFVFLSLVIRHWSFVIGRCNEVSDNRSFAKLLMTLPPLPPLLPEVSDNHSQEVQERLMTNDE
jgi:hypothetical protein